MKKAVQIRDRRAAPGRMHKALQRSKTTAVLSNGGTVLRFVAPATVYKLIIAPSHFSLRHHEARSAVLIFLARLRKAILLESVSVKIDFTKTEYMEPMAALLFIAELDRALRMRDPEIELSCRMPFKRATRQLLSQLGILAKLGTEIDAPANDDLPDNIKYWSVATGTDVGENAGSFLDNYEGRIAPALSQGVWKALSEALVNSVQHAYLEARGDGCPAPPERRWWMLTQERDGQLTVVVCDLGIGIRRSLPLRWDALTIGEIFKNVRSTDGDVRSIRAALAIGATRTGESNRGQGLPQIWNGMKREDVGGVGIMSGKGYLSYAADQDNEYELQFADNVLGTLIMWTVALREPATDG